ncbi:hypothetical protein ZWY2020_052811 [Hordeum vulgare]|nr:hypothetical protein ZWY2020_052811 [Hordeum vulgare]
MEGLDFFFEEINLALAAKKRKPEKDPNHPKRPASAFFVFMDTFRKEYKEKNPEVKKVSVAELKERLSKVYEVKDHNCIFVFKFRTHFGGGKSSGFGLIYDNLEAAKKFEPKYSLIRRSCYQGREVTHLNRSRKGRIEQRRSVVVKKVRF